MDTKEIIAQIDSEIARLQEARSILSNTTGTKAKRGPNKARLAIVPVISPKRTMSAEGRARIAAAQKARWAKAKRAAKTAQKA
jgi:hypothetical protein